MDTLIKFIYIIFFFFAGALVYSLWFKIIFKMLKDLEDKDK